MIETNNKARVVSVAILSAWSGMMFVLYASVGVKLFHTGDFNFRTAMAYHGILIPAWMLLMLAYSQHIKLTSRIKTLLGIGSVSAGILTGLGAGLLYTQGFSIGIGVQIAGMVIAEITALTILIKSVQFHFTASENSTNKLAWWTVTIALSGLSLATPLGHLAGAAKDLGDKFPLFAIHQAILKLAPDTIISGYVGSHSHQILAAFLAAAFALPLMQKSLNKLNIASIIGKCGLVIISVATVAQVVLYQYCAWFGWEPPDLFANGPNGLPLDDFVLVMLGLGMLLLIPDLIAKSTKPLASADYTRVIRISVAMLLLAYMIAVVALGLYIEFHEQYFGHAEGGAPGVPNDLAYIRAHLLFGFMIIPILLGTLLNCNLLGAVKQRVISAGTILVVITGLTGIFDWTLFLHPLPMKISIVLTAMLLLVFTLQLAGRQPIQRRQ